MRIDWIPNEYGPGFVAKMGDVTLFASPDQTSHFGTKPKRGTRWRFGCTHWCETTRCASRYGRDAWDETCTTAKDAMRAAEHIYSEARA
jgi:hypothetical protein